MTTTSRFRGMSERIDQERRQGFKPIPGWVWPQGDKDFSEEVLTNALREGWRLEHLGRKATPEEESRCRSVQTVLGAYLSSLPADTQFETTAKIIEFLKMEPKTKPEGETTDA